MRCTKTHRAIPKLLAGLLVLVASPIWAWGARKQSNLSDFLASRGLSSDRVILPFSLTAEMRDWVHQRVPDHWPAEKKLQALADALLDPEQLSLEYSRAHTGSAEEVFRDRRANCLAFTNLFVGMARELGVPVYFLSVRTEIYRKHGDLVVLSDHIAVGHGQGRDVQMYDFSERENRRELRRVRWVPDYTAIAMFYSNRGAEMLQTARLAEAAGHLRTAVTIDSELASAWSNLGVVLRRLEDHAGAERAYRRAIEVDPRIYTSYHNLSGLLRLLDRQEEARAIDQLLAKAPNRNPYTYLALGDLSLRNQRLAEARRFYRRAMRLSQDDAEPYAALGQVAAISGDLKTARRMLRKAKKLDFSNRRTVNLDTMMRSDRVLSEAMVGQ